MRCLKTQLQEGCHITYLTKPQYQKLVNPNPNVDSVLSWEGPATITQLQAEKFNYVIDLHHNIRTLRIKKALGAKHYSFPKKNIQKWLKVNFKMDVMPDVHIVDRYFEAVEPLGVHNDEQGLEYHFINPTTPNLAKWELQDQPFMCFAIGGQFATKKMPDHKIIEVLQKLEQKVVLLGGKEDQDSGTKIATESGPHVLNLCGQLSIDESAHLIHQCRVLLTHDTGMMHIGAALQKPVVSIWGNTTPEFGMYPYRPKAEDQYSIHEVNVKCRPCSKIGYQKCPKKHFNCMEKQDSDTIVKKALLFFSA